MYISIYNYDWYGVKQTTYIYIYAVWSYPCIYIGSGEFNVVLVKENACKVLEDTTEIRHCMFFASIISTAEAVANSVLFCWIHSQFKSYFANLKVRK